MTEGLKIALTAVGGITVFVVGQIIQKWFIDPIQEQRKLVGEIVHSIIFYANLPDYSSAFSETLNIIHGKDNHPGKEAEVTKEAYGMAKDKLSEGIVRLRNLSSQIHQNIQVIPCYPVLEFFRVVRKRKVLYEVAMKLVEMGSDIELSKTIECQDKIIKLFKVKHLIKAAKEREEQMAKLK